MPRTKSCGQELNLPHSPGADTVLLGNGALNREWQCHFFLETQKETLCVSKVIRNGGGDSEEK